MWNNFFKHIDIKAENTHILDGNAADLQAECDTFERKIVEAGGIELFVGGDLTANHKLKMYVLHTHTKAKTANCAPQVLDQTATLPSMSQVPVWCPELG